VEVLGLDAGFFMPAKEPGGGRGFEPSLSSHPLTATRKSRLTLKATDEKKGFIRFPHLCRGLVFSELRTHFPTPLIDTPNINLDHFCKELLSGVLSTGNICYISGIKGRL
jgi:hypothetical protein